MNDALAEPTSQRDTLAEPTKEDLKNGWTAESLTAYLRDREAEQRRAAMTKPKQIPARAHSAYDLLRWRGR